MTKLKILPLLLALALGHTALAQDESPKSTAYPQYEFWSNWNLGAELIYGQHYASGTFADFQEASGLGWGLVAEKEINHVWDVRLHFAMPVVDATLDRYGKLSVDGKFSFNNAFCGYNPDCRLSIYATAGLGVAALYQSVNNAALVWQYGLGASFNFGGKEHGAVYLEYVIDNITDFEHFDIYKHSHGALVLGLMYRLGPTEKDLLKMNANDANDAEALFR